MIRNFNIMKFQFLLKSVWVKKFKIYRCQWYETLILCSVYFEDKAIHLKNYLFIFTKYTYLACK